MAERSRWQGVARALAVIALLAYPLLVWRGLASGSPRTLALVLLVVLTPAAWLRLRQAGRPELRGLVAVPLVTLASLTAASILDSVGFILLVPVAINACFLVAFGSTLRAGAMPMVERFARLQEPDLAPAKQAWCRTWTALWCLFFLANGSAAALLGALAPLSWWAFYNGFLAYLLIGLVFATELVLRRRRFGRARGVEPEAELPSEAGS